MAVVSVGAHRRRPSPRARPLLAVSVTAVVLLLLGADAPVWLVPETRRGSDWRHALAEAETALAAADTGRALARLREARRHALASRTWDGPLEVGTAYHRLADDDAPRQEAIAAARTLFLTALLRARSERSLPGVLRTATAFARLGDREMVTVCLRVAHELAGADPAAHAQVRAAASAWDARLEHERTRPVGR